MLARRSESNPLELVDREFNRLMNRFWGNGEVPATLAPYAVDVHEDNDHFYVEAELPGFNPHEVDITLEDGVLTIRAERQSESKPDARQPKDGRQPLHIERRWSRFERSFTLPTAVNENSVHASMDGGILTVTLDKREEVKPRKIQINAGQGNNANKSDGHAKTSPTNGPNVVEPKHS